MSDSLNLRDQLQSIIRKLEAIPEMKGYAEPFRTVLADLDRDCLRIGVIGITSSGKSTFLNVLLGQNLLPEQSKATTNMLVYCRKGPRLTMEVIWQNGRPPRLYEGQRVTPATVAEYCCEDKNPENIKGVERVAIRSPEMLLPAVFELVDTPGIDAYGHEEHEELALRKFLPKADIVLYATSIKNPIKHADARVLGQVVQNDQRVLFVQTFKDVVKDSSEIGRVIKTREQELQEWMQRIRDDVKKCAPSLKARLFCQISSYLAKNPLTYRGSGFDDLLQDIRLLGKEMDALIQERHSGEVIRHLDLCMKSISKAISRMIGDLDAAKTAQRELDERIRELKYCIETLVQTTEGIRKLDVEELEEAARKEFFNSPYRLGFDVPKTLISCSIETEWWNTLVKLSESMNGYLDDCGFRNGFRSLANHIEKLPSKACLQLDKAEKDCQAALARLKIPPSRFDDTRSESSPSAPDCPSEKRKVKQTVRRFPGLRKGGFFERIISVFTDVETVVEITEEKLDRPRARNVLVEYLSKKCEQFNNHLPWWREELCIKRYLDPVRRELKSAENLSTTSTLCPTASLEDIQQVMRELTSLRGQVDHIRLRSEATRRTNQEKVVDKTNSTSPRSNGNLLRSLLHSRRELAFHRQLLACMNGVSSSGGPQTLLCLGGKNGDHQELISLLTHRLKDVDSIHLAPGLNVWCHPDGEPPRFFLTFKGKWELHLEPRRLINRLRVISHSPEGPRDKNLRWVDLFESVDAVAVFVNCSQIGSGLNDIEKSDWIAALSKFKPKAFYVGLDMSYYRCARAHELVTQVLPALKTSSLGSRPYLLADQYDTRFTLMVQYGEKLLKAFPNAIKAEWRERCREAVLEWQTNKISFRAPFTREALLESLKRIYDDRPVADCHTGSSGRR